MRARLERDEGHFPKNHVIWFRRGAADRLADLHDRSAARHGPLAVRRGSGQAQADARRKGGGRPARRSPRPNARTCRSSKKFSVPGIGPVCQLPAAQTRFATPRVVAGESITTDNQECQLKPLVQSDFYPVTFTGEQWSLLAQAFPAGVCDFSKPGRQPAETRCAGAPTRTTPAEERSSTAAGRSAGRPRAPAKAGRARRFAGWLK